MKKDKTGRASLLPPGREPQRRGLAVPVHGHVCLRIRRIRTSEAPTGSLEQYIKIRKIALCPDSALYVLFLAKSLKIVIVAEDSLT